MNEINKKLNFFKNYLNGFNDIAEGKSREQVALGFAKVASYLILPLIVFKTLNSPKVLLYVLTPPICSKKITGKK